MHAVPSAEFPNLWVTSVLQTPLMRSRASRDTWSGKRILPEHILNGY